MKRMLPVVLDIIKKYGTNDPNEIASAMHISVKKAPLPDEIGGFFLKAERARIYFRAPLSKRKSLM